MKITKAKKGRFTNHFIKIMNFQMNRERLQKQNIGTNKAKLVQMYKSEIYYIQSINEIRKIQFLFIES